MPTKSLLQTNPYLKDPVKRDALFRTMVATSTAIEGVHAAVAKAFGTHKKSKKTVKRHKIA